jgi:hypothetical protein
MSSTRILSIVAFALLVGLPPAHAQSDQTSGPSIPDRNYQLLRGDEDWSFLRGPALRQDFWDPIKYIPLRRNSPDWYLTISGEAREVWEQTGNNNWGEQPFWNNVFLERYMLGFDAHYGKHFRTFVEFKSGLESFRIGGPRPIDEKKLDFQNAFLDVGTGGEQNWVTLRVGVQELEYGAGRLIDVQEGPNTSDIGNSRPAKSSLVDGHLPYPYGRELTGYEVANLTDTLTKAKAAGVEILVAPFTADQRTSSIVQFPGGYIAEIHSITTKPSRG